MRRATGKYDVRTSAALAVAAALILLMGLAGSAQTAVSIATPGAPLKDGDFSSVSFDAGGWTDMVVELSYDGGMSYEVPPVYEGLVAATGNPLIWTAPISFITSTECMLMITCGAGGIWESSTSGLFTIDNSAPVFTSSPTPSATGPTDADVITISWTADDQPISDGITAEYRIDSTESLDYTPTDSPIVLDVEGIGLTNGKHTIDVRLTDAAGNQTTESVDIYIDRTSPAAFLVSADPSGWAKGMVRITFDATDLGSSIDHYTVSVDGVGDYGDQTSPFDLDVSSYPSGDYAVRVTAVDDASNTHTSDVVIHVDNTPPGPFDATADTSGWTNGDVNISFLTSDPTPGSGVVDHYEVSVDGGPYVPHPSPYTVTLEGGHTVLVRALDGTMPANVTDANFPVYTLIDRTPPQLDGCFTWGDSGGQSVSVDYTVSDALSGIKQVSLWYKKGADGAWTNSGLSSGAISSTFFFETEGDGVYYFGFVIEDHAGNLTASNTGDGACSFLVDTLGPTFDNIIATPHYAKPGTEVNISFTVSKELIEDPWVDVNYVEAYLVSSSGLNYTYTYTVPPDAEEGPAEIYIEGFDLLLNYNWTSNYDQLTIDSTPPEDFTPMADPAGWTNSSSVVISFEATDSISAIDYYEVAVDDGAYSVDVSPYGLDTTGLSDGPHTVHVKAVDLAGNELIRDVTVLVDKSAPADFTPAASPSTWTNGSAVEITFGASDAMAGIARYEVALDAGAYSSRTSPYMLDVSSVADGVHTVHVKAIDNAGNETTKDVAIQLDKTAPLAFVPMSAPSDWTDQTTAEISWSTSDAASGIDHYELAVDGGAYTNQVSPYALDLGWLASGNHTVHVKAVDVAGNSIVCDFIGHITNTAAPTAALTFTDPRPTLGRQFDYIFWKNWMNVRTAAQNTYNINWTASGTGKALANVYIEYRENESSDWILLRSSTSGSGTVGFDVSDKPESDSYQFRIRAVDEVAASTTVVYDKFGVYDATKLVPTAQIITPMDGATLPAGAPFAAKVEVSLPVFGDPRAAGKAYKDGQSDWWFVGHSLNASPKVKYYKKRSDGVPTKLLGTLLAAMPRMASMSVAGGDPAPASAYLGHVIVNTWQASCVPNSKAANKNYICQLEMSYRDVVTVGNMRQPDKPNKPGETLPSRRVEPLIGTLKQCEYTRFCVR